MPGAARGRIGIPNVRQVGPPPPCAAIHMDVVSSPLVRFGVFEVDLRSGDLRKAGVRIPLHEQPFQILKLLVEHPGQLVTRDELRRALWPSDTFVDFEHALNAAVKRLRDTLGDSADAPRYIETIPRRGYRFIVPVEWPAPGVQVAAPAPPARGLLRRWVLLAAIISSAAPVVVYLAVGRTRPAQQPQPTLTRVTFEAGFQHAPTWSPDGRFIAYGSAGPTLDVWVQPIAGGNPVQVTRHPARDWFPNWSPDGTQIVFRSERDGGGLYLVPVLGGQERKLTSFGYYPKWSPDGSRVLFTGSFLPEKVYIVTLDGSQPQEVAQELSSKVDRIFADWHPDGRLSVTTVRDDLTDGDFWVLPLSGGAPIKSERSAGVERTFKQAGLDMPPLYDYVWAPSGDAIFFSGRARGVSNIWRVSVDPKTLQWVSGPEQLTSGAGDDGSVAISRDGRKLAFNISTWRTRLWALPFDAAGARVLGPPEPLTPEGWLVQSAGLSPNGRKLAFVGYRPGDRAARHEVWAKDLDDGSERLLIADSIGRGELRWSPDATRLAYSRGQEVMIYDSRSSEERPLASAAGRELRVTDWSRDGAAITAAGPAQDDRKRYVSWLLPVTPGGEPDGPPRLIASNPGYGVYQTTISPDGRWICFEAVEYPRRQTARLYVVPASGGAWIPVTDGGHWDDKPRWAPDGKTIYFLSNRVSDAFFFDLWGVRFDADAGRAIGEPFRVETSELPGYVALVNDPSLAVAANRVVLTVGTVSGNVWVLDGVDKK